MTLGTGAGGMREFDEALLDEEEKEAINKWADDLTEKILFPKTVNEQYMTELKYEVKIERVQTSTIQISTEELEESPFTLDWYVRVVDEDEAWETNEITITRRRLIPKAETESIKVTT